VPAEVAVVALHLAGEGDVEGVVDVVVPLRRHPAATLGRGGDRRRVVEVALGDELAGAAHLGRQRRGGVGQLGEVVACGVVLELVHGVEAQRVDVVVAEPSARVVDEERPHDLGTGVVEVDRRPPRRLVGLREVRREPGEVVAARPEVVVDDVEGDAEAAGVAGVDETGQARRPAVGVVHGVEADAVVAPAPVGGEGRDRHQLDDVDAEGEEVVEPGGGRVERALRREGPDVQLVDDRTEDPGPFAGPTPGRIRPGEGAGVDGAARPVDAVGLPSAAGSGSGGSPPSRTKA